MRAARVSAAVAAAALLAASAPAAISVARGSAKPVTKTVRVGDYFFAPKQMSVPKGSKVVWRWPKTPGDLHDVYLVKRPKGVKRFHSDLAASDYSFRRTLKKPGRYVLVCTLHDQMRMTIRVRR